MFWHFWPLQPVTTKKKFDEIDTRRDDEFLGMGRDWTFRRLQKFDCSNFGAKGLRSSGKQLYAASAGAVIEPDPDVNVIKLFSLH
jgi:hypothetical protein